MDYASSPNDEALTWTVDIWDEHVFASILSPTVGLDGSSVMGVMMIMQCQRPIRALPCR